VRELNDSKINGLLSTDQTNVTTSHWLDFGNGHGPFFPFSVLAVCFVCAIAAWRLGGAGSSRHNGGGYSYKSTPITTDEDPCVDEEVNECEDTANIAVSSGPTEHLSCFKISTCTAYEHSESNHPGLGARVADVVESDMDVKSKFSAPVWDDDV